LHVPADLQPRQYRQWWALIKLGTQNTQSAGRIYFDRRFCFSRRNRPGWLRLNDFDFRMARADLFLKPGA
jgi:hypothetical protein